MKRTLLIIILALASAFTLAFGLTACDSAGGGGGGGQIDVPDDKDPNKDPDKDPDKNPDDGQEDHTHDFKDWKVRFDATCTSEGLEYGYCECGKEEEKSIPALGHDPVDHASQSATCMECGWEAYQTCTRCNDLYNETYREISSLGHDSTVHERKEATCTEDGYDEYQTCTRCDDLYNQTYSVLPQLGHDPRDHEACEAGCTWSGWEAYQTCSRCEDLFNETFKEIPSWGGHDEEVHPAKEATCTEAGWVEYKTCSRCENLFYETYEEIFALDHIPEFHNAKSPTCTEVGWSDYWECTREGCGYTTYEEKEALGHSMFHMYESEATCTEDGHGPYDYCLRNGCDYATQPEVIPAKGHNMLVNSSTDWDWDGYESATVTAHCMHHWSYTETVSGVITSEVTKESTCTTQGEITFTATVKLGTLQDPQEYTNTKKQAIDAEGHNYNYSEAEWNWTSIWSRPTASFPCTKCDGYDTHWFDIDTKIETTTQPKCEEEGVRTAYATLTLNGETFTDEFSEPIEPNGHGWVWSAELKTHAAACSECDKHYETELHDWDDNTCTICSHDAGGTRGMIWVLNDDDTYTLSGKGSARKDIVVPSTYNSLPVVAIANNAFKEGNFEEQSKKITSLVINEGVTSIGANAFDNCKLLESVKLPGSLKQIGDYAFYNCSAIKAVYYTGTPTDWCVIDFDRIEYSGTEMPYYSNPLYYAHNLYINDELLTEIVIPDSLTINAGAIVYCTSIKSATFSSDLIDLMPSSLKTVVITKGNIITRAFGNRGISSITLQSGITDIDTGAFASCKCLVEVNLPDSLRTIGDYAFSQCVGLTSLSIPNSVVSIGEFALYGCDTIESLDIPFVGGKIADKAGYDTVLGYIFGYETSSASASGTILQYPGYYYYIPESLREVNVSGGKILDNAFYNCADIEKISITDNVISIGKNAFYGCTKLTFNEYKGGNSGAAYYIGNEDNPYVALIKPKNILEVSCEINENTVVIGSNAFENATNLYDIKMTDNLVTVGDEAFKGCTKLAYIYHTENAAVAVIGNRAFYGCSSLWQVSFPAGLKEIGDEAFAGCSKVSTILIPSGMTRIGNNAFHDTAYYKDSANWSGALLYKNTYLLEINSAGSGTINVKQGTTLIADGAFEKYSDISSVTLPDSLEYIGEGAFYGTGITRIAIPSGVKSIATYAFKNCTELKNVTLHDELTSIGNGAFSGCSGLTSITIPGSVTSIGSSAFSGCSGLTSITIPGSVTSIGSSAFSGCSGLTSITIPDSVTFIGASAFFRCSVLTSIIIPDSVTTITEWSFYECKGLISITIPSSVTSIEKWNFYGCNELKTVYFIGTAEEWAQISIEQGNDPLSKATCYFYSEEQPEGEGNFWHYGEDGKAEIWAN